ncbi:LCM-domain-containing protein [Pseudovirgaria hyperparasitica]|uniref:tRNA wybutosine-synthesizing protein 4 n=1 Tax=Pseudovirgaria hyperparasitica TaxID=470096 RepID=A0A6A6VVV3_9PEZI|nr:LCM-domain-containing protein [Pseudovirgaria hyperparasitica]KAF2753844.1 LCM-domain-containing protein [Pseudovirgaria hyperparasitica]
MPSLDQSGMAAPCVETPAGASAEKRRIAKAARLRRIKQQEDDSIMGTNDSSIVSKRSVSKLYYPDEPDFYEPVTARFQRRHPLINRGYWLRMQAVEHTVLQFLDENQGSPKAVVNLGCGYDPLPWQFWHRYPTRCEGTLFVDVDYPDLIRKKESFISRSPLLQQEVPALSSVGPESNTVLTCGEKYALVGCDLRELKQFEKLLLEILNLRGTSILFIAEVSMTYMRVDDADALIRWANTIEHAQFCMLEQYLPDGSSHPFAATMLAHFNKLGTPLQAIPRYPRLEDHRERFGRLGWPSVQVQSLWTLWNNLQIVKTHQRHSLDIAEPFDEWEEFALFAGHYFLLIASNGPLRTKLECSDETGTPKISATDAVEEPRKALSFSPIEFTDKAKYGTNAGVRRFAACVRSQNEVVCSGGLGAHGRLTSEDVWSRGLEVPGTDTPIRWTLTERQSNMPESRVSHTITKLGNKSNGTLLMAGGRSSPKTVFEDCYQFEDNQWSLCGTLQPGRFRHCVVPTSTGILTTGGKTAAGEVLSEWRYWSKLAGWVKITLREKDHVPPARFGGVMCRRPGGDRGILFGGMDKNGIVLTDMWEWQFNLTEQGPQVSCRPISVSIAQAIEGANYSRFGANLIAVPGSSQHSPVSSASYSFMLVGGISHNGVIPASEEIVWLNFVERLIEDAVHPSACRVLTKGCYQRLPATSIRNPRPLLIGCAATKVSDDQDIQISEIEGVHEEYDIAHMYEVLICGGGAVCFSFGSFHNRTSYSLVEDFGTLGRKNILRSPHVYDAQKVYGGIPQVEEIKVNTKEDFDMIVTNAKPVIIRGSDVGSCTELWTHEYLVEHIGAETEIIVHSCPNNRMTFSQKNFSYVKQAFGDFIKAIQSGEKLYLRSVSNKQPFKQPTKLDLDFPGLAADFQLPGALQRVKDALHSSPLRISGPVRLWLHYDVLANVLCQVRGTKTIRLYPPGDVDLLGFGPGSSSSNIDVFGTEIIPHTCPVDAKLQPGDILYIPPMWMHGAMPTAGNSVAVNCFFRNLETGYAMGKDVYGNRDLQSYEQGRRDVEKLVRSFDGIPRDIRRFYLQRLAAELRSHAGGEECVEAEEDQH